MGSFCEGCCSPEHIIATNNTVDVETASKKTDRKRLIQNYSNNTDSSSDEAPTDTPRYRVPKQSQESEVIEDFKDAVLQGRDSVVLALHEMHPSMDLIHLKFDDGDDCLRTAVKHAQYEVMEYLLRAGVSPNEQNQAGETVLHLAVHLNDIKSVRLLDKFGADVNITNNEGATAADIAYRLKYDDLFDLLMDDDQGDLLQLFPHESTNKNQGAVHVKKATVNSKDTPTDPSLKEMDTARLNEMTDDLLLEVDIEQEAKQRKTQLAPLRGWLSVKQTYSWSKRWMLVQDGYLMWSDREILPGDEGITSAEKKRWDQCIALDQIENVDTMQNQTGRRFTMKIKGEKRATIWGASDTQERDKWITGLKQQIAVHRQEMYAT